ncbi:MAG: 16S rRNA (guanine(527)-N(7))-methyltransferase RsmG [Anaerolineaceae bacterium]|nr:16S rRNA (guanine(527)-N(7))-methyltransferase RsmG [Anaerolineaceae bacterium]
MQKLYQDALNQFGIHLTQRQISAFERYEEELLVWNNRFNLTAIRDSEGIRAKHFLDSLSCILAWRENPPASLIDIGTGAGFPGIPLKILQPSLQLALVESVGKKAEFCRYLSTALGLDNVEVIQTRAEDVGQLAKHREHYDWAVARAVASLPTLVEFLLPLVHMGGSILAQKGESGPAEAHASERAIRLLGGRLRQLIKVNLPGVADERYLVIIDKIAATPPNYPRRVGIPAKKPL